MNKAIISTENVGGRSSVSRRSAAEIGRTTAFSIWRVGTMKSHRKDRDIIKSEIRKSTMEIIGKSGFESVTARGIGEFMGLKNVSLVNYYFGSREELILETLKINYFDVMSEVYYSMENYRDPQDKLEALFDKMLEIFMQYPYLIRLFYFDGIRRKGNIKPEYIRELMALQSQIAKRNRSLVAEVSGIRDEYQVTLKLYQLRGAMMYPPLAQSTDPKLKTHFGSGKNRKKYIEDIVRGICVPRKK